MQVRVRGVLLISKPKHQKRGINGLVKKTRVLQIVKIFKATFYSSSQVIILMNENYL